MTTREGRALCSHWKGGEWEEQELRHPATGEFTYSDGSSHPCCEDHVKANRGLAHGPGRFIPYEAVRSLAVGRGKG